MSNWFTNLFKKKETLLVAVVNHSFRWKHPDLGYFDWINIDVVLHCFEREDGQRIVKWTCSEYIGTINPLGFVSLIVLKFWSDRTANLSVIPSYDQVKLGTPIPTLTWSDLRY